MRNTPTSWMSVLVPGLLCALAGVGCEVGAQSPVAKAVTNLGTRKSGTDWEQFLGPTGDSQSSETGLQLPWPEAGPRLVWQARVGEGYASPAISNGRLFQFDRFGNQARLDCLNSETGKKLWQFEYATNYEDLYGYNNGPRCQPVVDHERVYTFGAEGMLHCLHVETGQVIWKVDTAADFGVIQNFFGVGSTPVVEGNLLIANIGGSPAEDRAIPPGRLDRVSSNGSAIVAFDKLTGKVVYKLGDDLASYSSPRIATIGGRRWGFVFARNGLLGFEPASGKLDFFFPWRATILESVNASSPVVVDDLVFISETYGPGSALLRVKPGGYDVVWQDELRSRDKKLQTHWNTAVHHQGYLYASSGRHKENAELRCIELKTGRVMWSQPDLTRCSLLYADGHLICLAEVGDLLVLKATPEKFDVVSHVVVRAHDAATGASPRLLKYPSWAAPILSHGLLYVRGPDWLVCLEAIPEK